MYLSKKKRIRRALLVHAALFVLTFIILLPVLWMILTSLKPTAETLKFPSTILPDNPTIQNYLAAWRNMRLGTYFINSLYVSLMTTFVAIVLGCMGGYALARFRMKGEKAYVMFILVTRMFPAVVFLIPFFIMMRNLGLTDSFTGLIISYTVFSLPFSIWLLRGFFRNIPSELEEAARIDGCTRAKAFTRIILPLSAPGIAATAVFCFILAWNEFMFANTLIMSDSKRMLTVALVASISDFLVKWNELMAGGMITTIPVIIFYLFMQKYITGGLTEGSVKG